MKRLILCLLVMVIVWQVGTVNNTVYASEVDRNIYNGKLVNGRIYAPIRAVGEKMNAQVNWNAATKTATLIKDEKVLTMKLGSKVLKVNNKQIQMDVTVLLENGTIFLPLRFIGEALGHDIQWYKETRIAALEQGLPYIVIYAQPLFYKDGYKLLDEAIAKVKNVSTVAQKRQYLKPYFTDEMINLIIKRNKSFTDMSKATISYYSYPKETNMMIHRELFVPEKAGYITQDVLLTKRNNQWVVGSIDEGFMEIRP